MRNSQLHKLRHMTIRDCTSPSIVHPRHARVTNSRTGDLRAPELGLNPRKRQSNQASRRHPKQFKKFKKKKDKFRSTELINQYILRSFRRFYPKFLLHYLNFQYCIIYIFNVKIIK